MFVDIVIVKVLKYLTNFVIPLDTIEDYRLTVVLELLYYLRVEFPFFGDLAREFVGRETLFARKPGITTPVATEHGSILQCLKSISNQRI